MTPPPTEIDYRPRARQYSPSFHRFPDKGVFSSHAAIKLSNASFGHPGRASTARCALETGRLPNAKDVIDGLRRVGLTTPLEAKYLGTAPRTEL